LVGLVSACAVGETAGNNDDIPDPPGFGGSAGSDGDTAGSFSQSGSGSGSGSSGGNTAMGGSFVSGGETTGGTFATGGFITGGTFGMAGTPAGGGAPGGGSGGSGGSGGASGGSGGTGGAGKAGSGGTGGKAGAGGSGTGGSPPNGNCGQNPVGAKTGWTATASKVGVADLPPQGIDGMPATRYTSAADSSGSDWFQIDLGASVSVSRVVLTENSTDFMMAYEVRMSDDSATIGNSTPIITGAGQQGTTTINFPSAKVGRYLRITNTMATDKWWSIHEIDVTCQ
jgi:hypothetical protein